jgi:HTH-type transcriptional regulator, sugar sensing transcriptional regulator
MEEHELVSHIEDLGLSNKESRVYLACLSIGAASVQAIADRAGIKRVTAYVVLESLQTLGLVSQLVKAKKTYFVAEEPDRLDRLLKNRADELLRQTEAFKTILPSLATLKGSTREQSEMKFYDGVDALKTLFKDFFTTYQGDAKEYLLMSNLEAMSNLRGTGVDDIRVVRGIRCRLLYGNSSGSVYPENDKKKLQSARFLNASKYPIPGEIGILGNFVVMVSPAASRPVGVTVRNSEIARSMRTMFEMAWAFAGRDPGLGRS